MVKSSSIFETSFFLLFAFCLGLGGSAQSFNNVSDDLGISITMGTNLFGAGVSFYDFDHDGWDDLTFGISNGPSKFYRNINGSFQQMDPLVSVNGAIKALQWVDYDNDGDSDLFVTVREGNLILLRNDGDWNFTDVSSTCGLFQNDENTYGASWGDYDLDGDLDVYICTYDYQTSPGEYARWNHLYRNNGDGTFSDVTLESNTHDGISLTFQSIWVDYDRDGWPDLYLINDKISPNVLFRNLGNGTFEDVSNSTNTGLLMDAMTATWGDYDNDSLIDFYVTNTVPNGTVHMKNTGGGIYNDVSQDIGTYLTTYTWAAEWFDADNDMDLDMYVSEADPLNTNQPNHFFINNGPDQDYSYTLASDSLLSPDPTDAYSAASGDLDNDGAIDFVVQVKNPYTARIWHNTGNEHHWTRIGLTGVISNRDAIGSWIELYSGGQYQMRYTVCGENYIGQNSQYEHFGLGNNELIDSLIITWPSGIVETYYELAVDQLHQFTEGNTLSNVIEYTDQFVCEGDSVLLSVNTTDQVTWNTGQVSSSIYGMAGQSYWAVIENENGVAIPTDTVLVNIHIQPDVQIATSPASCFDLENGAVTWDITNNVDVAEIALIGLPNANLDSLPPGEHVLLMIDEFGCENQYPFTILAPDTIVIDGLLTHPTCHGDEDGAILIEVYNAQGDWEANWMDIENPEGISAGTYFVEVTDSAGCVQSESFELIDPSPLSANLEVGPFENTATASVTPEGGNPPYTVEWSTGATDLEIEIQNEGNFWVIITDASGCTTSSDFVVTDIPYRKVDTFNIFPNPADLGFSIKPSHSQYSIEIYDARGNKVASHMINTSTKFIETKYLPNGIYLVQVTDERGIHHTIKLIIHHD